MLLREWDRLYRATQPKLAAKPMIRRTKRGHVVNQTSRGEETHLDVLVVSNADDAHALAVRSGLVEMGFACLIKNFSDVPHIDWAVSPDRLVVGIDGVQYAVDQSTSVWWRRTGSVETAGFSVGEATLVRDETPHLFLGALFGAGVRWVDDPFAVRQADLKLWQLSTARRLDIKLPRTLVTNRANAAREFAGSAPTVAKALSPGVGIAPFVDEIDHREMDLVRNFPTLLQERVCASADLRVVVVNDRAWVWRRPRTGEAVDWRRDDPSGASFVCAPDVPVQGKAVLLSRALRLTTNVQDWLEVDGEHLFLEVNPVGSWMFLEGADRRVTPHIVALLAGCR